MLPQFFVFIILIQINLINCFFEGIYCGVENCYDGKLDKFTSLAEGNNF